MINSAQAAKGYQQASATMQRSWGRKLIENVQPRLGNVILDLGCGTGELSAYLAELVGRDGKVVAVDPDTARVKLAQKTHGGISNLAIQETSQEWDHSVTTLSFPTLCFTGFRTNMRPSRTRFRALNQAVKFCCRTKIHWLACLSAFLKNLSQKTVTLY